MFVCCGMGEENPPDQGLRTLTDPVIRHVTGVAGVVGATVVASARCKTLADKDGGVAAYQVGNTVGMTLSGRGVLSDGASMHPLSKPSNGPSARANRLIFM